MLPNSMSGDWEWMELWLRNGGVQTLDSYEIDRGELERRLGLGHGFEDLGLAVVLPLQDDREN